MRVALGAADVRQLPLEVCGVVWGLGIGKILLEEQRSALRAKVALKSAFGAADDAKKDDAN